ncbi:hypothetical protein GCM10027290_34320 [Micromonospora sonneratiae]|uniref:Tryptophan-associated transmembrane protein (Trp_oprn_chp) n=1 Tax=Micromonospora sonneratiae TaxID=1184706 RepID=A0ABW3YJ56_9ACTN
MSNDHPVPRPDARSDGAVVIEWGNGTPSSPGRTPRLLTGFLQDRRLAPVVAGLGAVAVFASLVGEWTITTLPDRDSTRVQPTVDVTAGVSEIGSFGIGYLVGVLGLVSVLSLVLFGSSPTVRHNARVVGLAVSVGLLAILTAATYALDADVEQRLTLAPGDRLSVVYGRGLVMAFVGTAALGLALYLVGLTARLPYDRDPHPDDQDHADSEAGDDGHRAGDEGGDRGDGGGWPWQRRRSAEPDVVAEVQAATPDDLTVSPAVPFASWPRRADQRADPRRDERPGQRRDDDRSGPRRDDRSGH